MRVSLRIGASGTNDNVRLREVSALEDVRLREVSLYIILILVYFSKLLFSCLFLSESWMVPNN